jgi:tetratricopeptide (TPR) repeat protein
MSRVVVCSRIGIGLIAVSLIVGCASLRRYKVVPESVAACRKLSQEGVAALEKGDCDLALSLLDEAVATSPDDVDARRQLAEALWRQGDSKRALAAIEAAVKLDPHHAATVVRAGQMALATDEVDLAWERAQQAIVLDRELAESWALRSAVARQRGELVAALADVHQGLRFCPNSPSMLLSAAELQYQLGRPQRSLITLHHLLDVYPPGEEPQRALWLEGLAYSAVDRHEDAAESLLAASQRGPAHAELLFQLAKAQQAVGRGQAAAVAARRALAADASHQGSRALLASLGQLDTTSEPILRR